MRGSLGGKSGEGGGCWAAGDCTARGKETTLLRVAEGCLLGLTVLGIRVIFHLGQDVWCLLRAPPPFPSSLDLGHMSIMVVIVSIFWEVHTATWKPPYGFSF